MTNKEIANVLNSIGELLEVLDENSFKITAYLRAARLVEMQTRELDDIYTQEGLKGLQNIKGIGQSISEKIQELLTTGHLRYQDKLIAKVPASIMEFNKIPGVGPKTAKKLYETFKSKTIRELQKILKTDKHLDKIKLKTRQNIIRGIDILSSQSGRMLLSFAWPIAQEIINALSKYSQINSVDIVGSLRRMQETIGDIDIVASAKDKKNNSCSSVINQFIKEKFVKKIISKGAAKATIIHTKDVQIDLEILPSQEYGSLLQHFTGSKDHNIALRTYAEKQGYSISEHGIKNLKNNTIIKCSKENQVYTTLNMQTPPPEIRENRGEIEKALKHQLPNLIKLSDIKGDLQMHSTYSDGQNSIKDMAITCKKRGYNYLGITDHPATLGITNGLKSTDIDNYLSDIARAEQEAKIRIFSGIEANIRPNGDLDLSDKVLAKFDFVIGSIHSSFAQDKEVATKRIIRAISNPFVSIIGHPTGRIINRRPGFDFDWQEVFRACQKHHKILEVNAYPDRLDINDIIIHQAIEQDIKLIINTDSHSKEHLNNMIYGVAQARRGWCEAKNIINTYSISAIEKVLNIHKN